MTPEQIFQWAREAGLGVAAEVPHNAEMLQAFAALVAAHEREECAREADHWQEISHTHKCGHYIAAAIRARK